MEINEKYLRNNVERFHKTATVLAEKVSGVAAGALRLFPIVIGQTPNLYVLTTGTKKGDTDFITPYVINAAFSLELCLKLARFQESGEWLWGHKLLELYKGLSQAAQEYIRQHVNTHTRDAEFHSWASQYINEQLGIEFSWETETLLNESSQAFDSWRYAFEQKRPSWFAGYNELRDAMLAYVDATDR
jgi:HEPN domain-containing protein